MKRYLCFGFVDDSTFGGLGDITNEFNDFESAMNWLGSKGYEYDVAYVFDRIEGKTYKTVPPKSEWPIG